MEIQLSLPFPLSPFERDCNKKIMDLLMEGMGYDIVSVSIWLAKEKPLLGNLSPIFMLNAKQGEAVLQLVERCKERNEW